MSEVKTETTIETNGDTTKETTTQTVAVAPPKPKNALLASIHAELLSRKWRATNVQMAGALAVLIPNLDKVWAWIVAGAMWAFALSAYVLGVAIEDNGTKRLPPGDTSISVETKGTETIARAKRTSLSRELV